VGNSSTKGSDKEGTKLAAALRERAEKAYRGKVKPIGNARGGNKAVSPLLAKLLDKLSSAC
jgi:hypothetical protein